MQKVLWLLLAGALGTGARALMSGVVQKAFGPRFPLGTASVNALGCLFFGLVWAYTEDRLKLSTEVRFIVLTGFMGAFTTFSTFAFESASLLQEARVGAALANVVAQNALGILCVFGGLALGRAL